MRFTLPSPAKSVTGLPVKGCTPKRFLQCIAGKSGGIGGEHYFGWVSLIENYITK